MEKTNPPTDSMPAPQQTQNVVKPTMPAETGGRKGPEPTRYGDWESKGKCVDF